ncbi:MAG: hypothetical protein ACRCYY_10600 [Trueperaceae bacterium]
MKKRNIILQLTPEELEEVILSVPKGAVRTRVRKVLKAAKTSYTQEQEYLYPRKRKLYVEHLWDYTESPQGFLQQWIDPLLSGHSVGGIIKSAKLGGNKHLHSAHYRRLRLEDLLEAINYRLEHSNLHKVALERLVDLGNALIIGISSIKDECASNKNDGKHRVSKQKETKLFASEFWNHNIKPKDILERWGDPRLSGYSIRAVLSSAMIGGKVQQSLYGRKVRLEKILEAVNSRLESSNLDNELTQERFTLLRDALQIGLNKLSSL